MISGPAGRGWGGMRRRLMEVCAPRSKDTLWGLHRGVVPSSSLPSSTHVLMAVIAVDALLIVHTAQQWWTRFGMAPGGPCRKDDLRESWGGGMEALGE